MAKETGSKGGADLAKHGKRVTGCFQLHLTGFRDFLLQGNVVDLAIAVVVGLAFVALVKAFVADLLMPLIAAIFSGKLFGDLRFYINGSAFLYGDFLNQLVTFLIICAVVYFCVVVPMQMLMKRFFPKVPMRACPFCLSQVPGAASACKFCTRDIIPLTAAGGAGGGDVEKGEVEVIDIAGTGAAAGKPGGAVGIAE